MASAAGLSAPGVVTYDSSTLSVGDGTWDFTKNSFLLPNLLGLNFETMRYNGMGNRFSTVPQYHTIILAHGLLGALVFLFIIPISVMQARFRASPVARRHHAYFNIVGLLLVTVVFVLGWFAVGPARSWTNPHHAIGLTLYIMYLLQAIGGRLVKNIYKRSLRLMIHRWSGRCIALLGIAQVPLGLTLYGSPKYTFILFAVWMAFLVVLYFVLSWRHDGQHHDTALLDARQHEGTEVSGPKKSGHGWLGPLAAGAGIFALMKSRKRRGSHSSGSSVSRTTRSRSTRHPEVIPSRRGSASYIDDEKYSDRSDHKKKGGGMMGKLFGVAGALGAGAMVKNYMDRREKRRYADEEYSAVATETPSRPNPATPSRFARRPADTYTESEFTEDRTQLNRPITPLLPGPGGPVAAAAAISAAERPSTPRPVRPPHARQDSFYSSEYSSYVSPSRRTKLDEPRGGAGKGILAAVGLGWLAKKFKDRRDKRAEEERLRYEDERRDGRHGSRYTGDGFSTPTRSTRRRPPPAVAQTATTLTQTTDESSMVETLPPHRAPAGPPMPPLGHAGAPHPAIPPAGSSVLIPAPVPVPSSRRHSRSHSRRSESKPRPDVTAAPVMMPDMPADPQGLFAPLRDDSDSEAYTSAGGGPGKRRSSTRRKPGDIAAATTVTSASQLIPDDRSRQRSHSRAPSKPVSVKVKYHDDRDRNVTLRRLTDEEAAAARRERRRGRSESISSMSDSEAPTSGRGRYRRASSSRRGRDPAPELLAPLSPPTPAFARGKKRQKDSAYYSGQPGPSGEPPAAAQTVSTLESMGSHGTWSALSESVGGPTGGNQTEGSVPASAADRRRRRRLERQGSRPPGAVEYS
ncbi:uncharacterized protein B0I36DRAFT_358479 [Microdochium trichocladiopsis]|uniref:Cytochrome b561 domain-containing protein n=1 Tax=Microdochium trichocladiopsis TaxID=1682393 RepID=A0A9P9BX73_9PEZI|nr:uncharacterized protein B0I36DRAFT_358479 [Microdochium trichocladiopsis]KAH7041295.1 hypothetical protein B0I36DRAFT_358479 [Microdochium trichocladiopsis]